MIWQDYRNNQNLKLIAVGETRTSTDTILSGISKNVGTRRTNLDTTVRNLYSPFYLHHSYSLL